MTARLLAALLFLIAQWPGDAARADAGRPHEGLLAGQLAAVEKSRVGVPELYFLAVGLSAKQDVFRNDVETLRDLFDRHWDTARRSVALVADAASRDLYAYPTRENLRRAARGLGEKLDPAKDVLFLLISSHGSADGLNATLPDGSSFKFTAVDVRKLLEETRARHRIVVLSACHSGALMSELKDEHTLVITAAHAARKSFGCSFTHLHTWFTQALYEALAATPDFERAFQAAARRIDEREQGGEASEHSLPQIHVGRAAKAKLADIERRARVADAWQPPVFGTEAGRVRQLMGDYLAVVKPPAGDAQVHWLQLRTVGTAAGGAYPVAAWSQLAHRAQGAFEASYDPAKRELTGRSPSLGQFRLAAEGSRLGGAVRMETQAPATMTLERVPRREVYEARAQNPPAKLRAQAGSTIRLLYLGARDCGHCERWERDHLTEGRLVNMPEFRHIELVTAKRASLKEPLRRGDLPPPVAHLYDRFEAEKGYAGLIKAVPGFVLLVDDQIRVWSVGAFLDSPIYPVLRAAVREKTGRPG